LFDLDGTLINSEEKLKADLEHAFAKLGEVFDVSVFEDWSAVILQKKRMRMINEQGRDITSDEEKQIVKNLWNAIFENRTPQAWNEAIAKGTVTIFPEVINVLETLKNKGYKLLMLSRSEYQSTVVKAKMFGLDKYFPRQYITPIQALSKTRGYLQAIAFETLAEAFEGAAVSARDATHLFIVGDRTEDMFAGEAVRRFFAKRKIHAKVITVLVDRKGTMKPKHAQFVVNDLREALQAIESYP